MKALFMFLLLLPTALLAQRVEGKFMKASVKLGEPVQYVVWLRHDPALEVLFPDTTYDFTPFELLHKEHFPTKTTAAGSLDSVVYTLATYELGAVQKIAVPVWVIDKKTAEGRRTLAPAPDSVRLEELIKTMPDSIKLQEQAFFWPMQEQFNYMYLGIFCAILLIAMALIWMLFGKSIKAKWKARSLKKKHLQFIITFDQHIESANAHNLEHAIAFWKQYAGRLAGIPLASFTTKEVKAVLADGPVVKALEHSDRVIYAKQAEGDLKGHLRALKAYAQACYEEELAAVLKN